MPGPGTLPDRRPGVLAVLESLKRVDGHQVAGRPRLESSEQAGLLFSQSSEKEQKEKKHDSISLKRSSLPLSSSETNCRHSVVQCS